MNLWPHQVRAITEIEKAIAAGHKRILLTIPTGGGKTRVAAELIKIWTSQQFRVGLYTNRRLLVTQLSQMLEEQGITHGLRASGRKQQHDLDVQISSVQTEQRRRETSKKQGIEYQLHQCQRVLVDEAHLNSSDGMLELLNEHLDQGAIYVGLTATPVDLSHAYQVLIQSGSNSELRACGALVEAIHFGPDEPDFQAFKRKKKSLKNLKDESERITEQQAIDLIMTPTIFGRVWEWFEKLNPLHEPTILFAPGVNESLWFAEQFEKKGVKAAHLDGTHIWVDGRTHLTTPTFREEVLNGSREGRITVLCNRFVLREGIDAPWLSYGIFATIFGSLQTYLQSGGRLLRSHPGQALVRIQDHGANWWRYGSLNADRKWFLENTGSMLQGVRIQALRDKQEREPFRCPKCAAICLAGRCRNCGWYPDTELRARPVVSCEGELRLMRGDIFRPRRIYKHPDGAAKWRSIFWRSYPREITRRDGVKKVVGKDRTFRQAEVIFAGENNWGWPDRRWPFMPRDPHDFYRLVKSVPFDRLIKETESGESKDRNTEAEASQGLFAD